MAEHVTTCRVLNRNDDSFITLFTEWLIGSDSICKIIVLLSDCSCLEGEMKLKDVEMFASNLHETKTAYLDMTRTILSGKGESEIQFVLKDSKLRWKKGDWFRGLVEVRVASSDKVLPNIIGKLLTRYEALESKVNRLEKETTELRNERRETDSKLEQMIDMKNHLENDLYSRFLIVLNSKKKKIRELECENNRRISSDKNRSVYEAKTDESEASDDDEIMKSTSRGIINSTNFLSRRSGFGEIEKDEKLLKREITDSEGNMTDSDYEDNKRVKKKNCVRASNDNRSMVKNIQDLNEPSTSNNHRGDKTSRISLTTPSVSRSNLTSEESEEDIFA